MFSWFFFTKSAACLPKLILSLILPKKVDLGQVYDFKIWWFTTGLRLFSSFRITSYNVCYTKLLRSFKEGKKRIKELSLEDTISLHTTTHLIHKKVQEADAIGLFSFYEGFPNAICEGMACAKPIVFV